MMNEVAQMRYDKTKSIVIISIYGDYGTSPRFGWIENYKMQDEIIADLEEEIEVCKRRDQQ